jgi:hypothetical protein
MQAGWVAAPGGGSRRTLAAGPALRRREHPVSVSANQRFRTHHARGSLPAVRLQQVQCLAYASGDALPSWVPLEWVG